MIFHLETFQTSFFLILKMNLQILRNLIIHIAIYRNVLLIRQEKKETELCILTRYHKMLSQDLVKKKDFSCPMQLFN